MAIPINSLGLAKKGIVPVNRVPAKKFTLSTTSDTTGIIDPNTGVETTARALVFKAPGTVTVVDTYGNVVEFTITQSFVDNLSYLTGEINGVTTASSIVAANIIVCV